MSSHITLTPANRRIVVRANNEVVADSTAALELREGGSPPVFYIPRAAVQAAMLTKTARQSTCPWKGQASYYTVTTAQGDLADVIWSYETPKPDMAAIAGHVAFYANRVSFAEA
jgi:uncharacterized protein (DUF427 family)